MICNSFISSIFNVPFIRIIQKSSLISLLMILFSSCAFNNSRDELNQQENKNIEEKNRASRNTYNLVTGFYQGTLHLPKEDRSVTLGIYILDVKEGSNSSGEPILKPVLKAVYRQLSPVEMPIILDVRFVPETGALEFVNAVANSPTDSLHTISAKISEERIQGDAKIVTGVLGRLDLSFVQKTVDAPSEGDEDQVAQKLREQYEVITGTYVGKMTNVDSVTKNNQLEWDIEIGIYSLEVKAGNKPNGEVFFKPVLKAVFKQQSSIAPYVILDGYFIAETKQIVFVNPNATTDDLHSINAQLSNQSINGIVKKSSGFWGNLHLELKSKTVITDPTGEENEFNQKLRERFQKITGTYDGAIVRHATANEPRKEWKTELGIYIIDVKNGTTPSGEPKFRPMLKARFKQLSPVAPNLILDVQYNEDSKRLTLLFNETAAPVPTPPTGLHSFSGFLKDNTIIGQASRASGYWGDMTLQFVTKNVDSPSFGDQEDYNRRLTEEYSTLIGNYTGTIFPEGFESFDVNIRIYIVPESGPNGLTPKLKAYYHRTAHKTDVADLTLNMEYKTELTPPEAELIGQRMIGSTLYSISMTGVLKNNELSGQFRDHRGQVGPFRLIRKNP